MPSPRSEFSIPLSERAYQLVMREATRAGSMPGPWLDAWINHRLRELGRRAEVSEILGAFQGA